jgi:hypothetical protein
MKRKSLKEEGRKIDLKYELPLSMHTVTIHLKKTHTFAETMVVEWLTSNEIGISNSTTCIIEFIQLSRSYHPLQIFYDILHGFQGSQCNVIVYVLSLLIFPRLCKIKLAQNKSVSRQNRNLSGFFF